MSSIIQQEFLRLRGVSKSFESIEAVSDLSLTVMRGEFFGLLGPSGCGKTTTLRLIAGLETPDAGAVFLDGQELTHLPAERRGFGMVFQHLALFPHLNVFENVAFGLRARHQPRGVIADRVRESLALVRLFNYEKRRMRDLSGGERQRVAIARAVAIEPQILLFDEPLSSLDVTLRAETRAELRELVDRLHLTAIYVTHDQEEAFELCDRIAVLKAGRIVQTGDSRMLYQNPRNTFVAGFLGRNNLIAAVRRDDGSDTLLQTTEGNHQLSVPSANLVFSAQLLLSIRPEHLELAKEAPSAVNVLPACISDVRFTGAATTVTLNARGLKLSALVLQHDPQFTVGNRCFVHLPPEKIMILNDGDN